MRERKPFAAIRFTACRTDTLGRLLPHPTPDQSDKRLWREQPRLTRLPGEAVGNVKREFELGHCQSFKTKRHEMPDGGLRVGRRNVIGKEIGQRRSVLSNFGLASALIRPAVKILGMSTRRLVEHRFQPALASIFRTISECIKYYACHCFHTVSGLRCGKFEG